MNFAELQQYISEKSNDTSIMPFRDDVAEKARWKIERDELMQHYEGIASKVLNEAFPNEDKVILDYRKKIYQPLTRGAF